MKKIISFVLFLVPIFFLLNCGGKFQQNCTDLSQMVTEYEKLVTQFETDAQATKDTYSEKLVNNMDAYVYEKKPPEKQKDNFYNSIRKYQDKAILFQKLQSEIKKTP